MCYSIWNMNYKYSFFQYFNEWLALQIKNFGEPPAHFACQYRPISSADGLSPPPPTSLIKNLPK